MIEHFASSDPYARISAAILRLLFGPRYLDDFSVELWDGSRFVPTMPPRFTLRFTQPGALRAMLRPPVDLNAGRAFALGLIECEGDMEAAVDVLMAATADFSLRTFPKLWRLLTKLPKAQLERTREATLRGRVHSRDRDRAAIAFHYDQSAEFYRTFLGETMTYSCAYFDRTESLDEAQTAKLDYVLRKLRVEPGERLLDIGCGWGSLVVRAASAFGARILGVTLSRRQYEEGQKAIAAAGVQDRARIELRDYRDLEAQSFDKIASIGMVEHVGRRKLPEYFGKAFSLLRPGGLFLNHGIAEQSPGRTGGDPGKFIDRFVFPDGEIVAIGAATQFAEAAGFEVRDIENLREHYMLTLRAWVANLERNRSAAIAAANEHIVNTWRLYMAGSAQGFRTGRMGIFQSLLAKPNADGSAGLPPTRRDLYA